VHYGWQEGAGSYCTSSLSKLMGFVRTGVVEILTLTILNLLNLVGGRMHGSQAYTLRKTCRTLIWGSYRPQHRGQTLIISSP